MSEPLYEFAAEQPVAPSRRPWVAAAILCPALAAAAWGVLILEQRRAHTLVLESFRLEVDVNNQVIVAAANVRELSEEMVRSLANYPRLQMIELAGTTQVEGGLRRVAEVDDLRVLNLRDCAWVDDEQAAWIGRMTNLKRLDLSGTRITDATLEVLRELPKLSILGLERCRGVTDAGLEICGDMPALKVLSPGGAGYSTDGLLDLRERRRDLHLWVLSPDAGGQLADHAPSAIPVVFTFQGAWRLDVSIAGLATDQDPSDVDATWRRVGLQGGNAIRCLERVFHLSPHLGQLTLVGTTLADEEFPFDQVPAGLHSIEISRTSVSLQFLEGLRERAALEWLHLTDVLLDGVPISEAKISYGSEPQPVDLINWGSRGEQQMGTSLQLEGPGAGRALAKLLSFADEVTFLGLREIAADRNSFPFERLPPGLRRMAVEDSRADVSFWQALAEQTALERLELNRVAVAGVDLDAPVWGRMATLRFLGLYDLTVNGAPLADRELEQLRRRLREILPHTSLDVYSTSPSLFGPSVPRISVPGP